MSYIDGMASGLNTTDIIRQLMQVEAIPQTLLKSKATSIQAGVDAYASIRTKVTAVRTAAEALHSATSGWRPLAATSSDEGAVSVSAGSGVPGGALSFNVTQLATAMQRSSADTFAGLDADLGGRTIAITRGGQTLESTATTLKDLVAEINADETLGVRASTIQVTPGQYRMVLTSTETGADNAFSTVSTGWSNGFVVGTAAQDAQLDVGGISVTRSSNTISDLIDGATITLTATTTSPVTVEVTRDASSLATKVKALVDAVNGALGEIKLRTGYNAETNQRSSLTGDATSRQLTQMVTSALGGSVAGSALGSVGLAGVELKRDGTFAFDEAAFTAAYEKDPDGVQALFTDGGSTTGHVSYTSAGWRAAAGSYDVVVTNDGGTYTATIDGVAADVNVGEDGSLRVAIAGSHGRLGGLTVQVAAAGLPADGDSATVGTIDYQPGAAKRLSSVTNRALDLVDGLLTTAEESRKARVKDIERQVEAWELRLEKRELGLRRQYTALETMLGQLSNQSQWLAGQLSGLAANSSTN